MSTAVVDEIVASLHDVATVRPRRRNVLTRSLAGARAGIRVGAELVVDDRAGRALSPFVVALPAVEDLLGTPVVDAVRAAVSIRRRFPHHLGAFKRISFDLSDAALVSGERAGHAISITSTIHLNAGYVMASRAPALGGLAMEHLVAHELWHIIELTWEARDYAATIAFRRGLGQHFGVETVERAITDAAARARVVEEVSAYGATGRLEATAEMFERWWNEGPVTPALAVFGRLVAEALPEPSS